ncbi:MAG: DNA polymerase III subunit delta' [Rickettsiales bacterium]|nr:DNA polymerase III subunit delta' [Pseudomonadota bacterium]MDA0965864.1 DNA polymerase III subunit delta' [Pseudomonadota bacterium]MDG4542666.1 DNA polymerase III subunit delta' [Rickettsiales bacterium]MDG4545170.1 DNA polymerase III subunit delta' [Rickettsiales bacterium]MDG4547293.1 DNA polymerase III subunit delta' [Rickettsiales bacterium]
MTKANKKEINLSRHPRISNEFYGHEKAASLIEDVLKTDRIPQSWLICGSKGVGKATLAYRFAKALLSGSNSLSVSENNQSAIRVAGGSHSDLLVIEPDEEKASGDISVDRIRKIAGFLRLSASETAYRIVIIDSADNMNNAAANALLKLLEEPPAKAIFMLVSHCPGKLLATIKSRCRYLNLGELSDMHASCIIQQNIPQIAPHENDMVTYLSNGSPGVAIELYNNDGIEIYSKIINALSGLPRIDSVRVQELVDIVTKKGDKIPWQLTAYLIDGLMIRIIKALASQSYESKLNNNEKDIFAKLKASKSIEGCLDIRERINALISDTSRIHLDKKAVIISIFREFV